MNSRQTISEANRRLLGLAVNAYYDCQAIRKASMNRLRAVVMSKLEGRIYTDREIMNILREGMHSMFSDEEREYIVEQLDLYTLSRSIEQSRRKALIRLIRDEPIWSDFLEGVKGISAILCASLLKEFGYCETYRQISSLWRISGLHVINGKAPKKEKGVRLDWNPRLRVLAWRIGDSMIKQRTPYYRDIYDLEKERQCYLMRTKAENAPKNKLHADLRARRKMVKIFLAHYWYVCRKIKGLETRPPYVQEKLGHKHIVMPSFNEETGVWELPSSYSG